MSAPCTVNHSYGLPLPVLRIDLSPRSIRFAFIYTVYSASPYGLVSVPVSDFLAGLLLFQLFTCNIQRFDQLHIMFKICEIIGSVVPFGKIHHIIRFNSDFMNFISFR